ncbi:hypothetical protein LCGC14_0872330 [marine sediment metagenome]|uniref:Phage tail collar domain-containing protein n=1 Tax=marine sediment metagenome TaxID=412755 RepID=A0A0F9RNY0_9ZZZZ
MMNYSGQSYKEEAGTIKVWYGLKSAIPNGWNACDGTNGTVNLEGKTVFGPNAGFVLFATGGTAFHTHAMTCQSADDTLGDGLDLVWGAGSSSETTSGHQHTVSAGNGNNLPPYKCLWWIQKL